MPKRDPRMIPIGYGKFVRADRVFALVPIEGDRRGEGEPALPPARAPPQASGAGPRLAAFMKAGQQRARWRRPTLTVVIPATDDTPGPRPLRVTAARGGRGARGDSRRRPSHAHRRRW